MKIGTDIGRVGANKFSARKVTLDGFEFASVAEAKRYGRLVIVAARAEAGVIWWACACDCGALVAKRATNVRSGKTVSCGCKRIETRIKHGMANTRVYNSWKNMIGRCELPSNASYKYYGKRGVWVCERWRRGEGGVSGFLCFLADMGDRPAGMTLDRTDVNGNYEPANCRWATIETQRANLRRPNINVPQVAAMRANKLTYREIAETTGYHPTAIAKVLRDAKRRTEACA